MINGVMIPHGEGNLSDFIFAIEWAVTQGRNQTRSPGNYGEVLSVGAITEKKRVASFSSSAATIGT